MRPGTPSAGGGRANELRAQVRVEVSADGRSTGVGSVRASRQRTADGLVAVDEKQRIVGWNDAVSRMLGLREELALGRRCYEAMECFDDEGRPLCRPSCLVFQTVTRGEGMASHDMLLKRRDGRYVRCSLSFLAVGDGSDFEQALFLIRPLDGEGAGNGNVAVSEPAAKLRFRCFGSFEVWVRGSRLEGPPLSREKAGRTLRLLVHRRGRKVPRDELAEILWPDTAPDTARARLKVIVHALRRGLEPDGAAPSAARVIRYENDSYVLDDGQDCWTDVDAFLEHTREGQACLTRGLSDQAEAHYLEAVRLYRGDYLAEDLYEDWAGGERQRLWEMHLSALMALASVCAGNEEFGRASDYCWQALSSDACREFVYRRLMDYLWRDGRPDEAVRAYRRCQDALHRQLGLQPLPETTDLYRRIKAQTGG